MRYDVLLNSDFLLRSFYFFIDRLVIWVDGFLLLCKIFIIIKRFNINLLIINMNKNYSIILGVVITAVAIFAGSLVSANEDHGLSLPNGFSSWKTSVPDGISSPVGQNERTHSLKVFRDQNDRLNRGVDNQLYSGNWSGYVLANYETGKTYTSASSTWIVSSATVPPGQSMGYSSSWVGIGGFCESASCRRGDGTLIQLGTESDFRKSGAGYYAWYEMLPQSETIISGLVVHPGDKITASLTLGGIVKRQQVWKLTMSDVTTGATWTKNVNYQSSELSADWIQEAPSSYSGTLPLADYNMVTFVPNTIGGGNNPSLDVADEVVMINPYGETSNPSAPNIAKNGFNTCWGNGTLTSCNPPIN